MRPKNRLGNSSNELTSGGTGLHWCLVILWVSYSKMTKLFSEHWQVERNIAKVKKRKKEKTSLGTAIDWFSEIWSILFIRLIINSYWFFWFVGRIHYFTIGRTIIPFCVSISATRTFLSLPEITLTIRPSLHSESGKGSSLIMTKSFSFKLFFVSLLHFYLGEWSHYLRLKFPFIYGAWLTISYAFTNAIFHSWKKSLVLVHAALCCTQHGTGFDEYMWSVSQRDETLLVSEWSASHHKITPSLYKEMELLIGGCFYCLLVALNLNLHILVKNTIVEIILSTCF